MADVTNTIFRSASGIARGDLVADGRPLYHAIADGEASSDLVANGFADFASIYIVKTSSINGGTMSFGQLIPVE